MKRCLPLLLLCGCSTITYEWTKDGSSNADQDRDYAECAEPHKSTMGLFGVAGALSSNSAITDCMRKRGWRAPTK